MPLFLLNRLHEDGYDEYDGFVIRAKTEAEARELANRLHADEGQVTCSEVLAEGEPGLILASFRSG